MPLTFSQPIVHGTNHLHMAPPPPLRRTPFPPGLVIRTVNIRHRRGFGLVQAILAVEHGGFDVMILTEKEI